MEKFSENLQNNYSFTNITCCIQTGEVLFLVYRNGDPHPNSDPPSFISSDVNNLDLCSHRPCATVKVRIHKSNHLN